MYIESARAGTGAVVVLCGTCTYICAYIQEDRAHWCMVAMVCDFVYTNIYAYGCCHKNYCHRVLLFWVRTHATPRPGHVH